MKNQYQPMSFKLSDEERKAFKKKLVDDEKQASVVIRAWVAAYLAGKIDVQGKPIQGGQSGSLNN